MLRFICDCGQRMNAPDRLAGTTVSCLGCHAPIIVREMACPPTGGGRLRLELGGGGLRVVSLEFRLQPARSEVTGGLHPLGQLIGTGNDGPGMQRALDAFSAQAEAG